MILDIPTLGHIPALISSFGESQFFAKFRSKRPEDISEYAVRVVFHQCGDGVLESINYKIFMNGFAPDVYVRTTSVFSNYYLSHSWVVVTACHCVAGAWPRSHII